VITWWFYTRSGARLHDVERGAVDRTPAVGRA